MKPLFLFLASLAPCIVSPLQPTVSASNAAATATATATAPTTDVQTQWTKAIVQWLEKIVNIPTTIPKPDWKTLSWDVVNYSKQNYDLLTNGVYFVVKDDFEYLLDKPMSKINFQHYKVTNMSYIANTKFSRNTYKKFKGNLSNAIGSTQKLWSENYVKNLKQLQQDKNEIDAFIQSLEGVKDQLTSPNDIATIKNPTMRKIQDMLTHNTSIQDTASHNNTYTLQTAYYAPVHFLKKVGSIPVKYQTIEKLDYIPVDEQMGSKKLTPAINLLKNNIVSLTLFIKETMNYDDLAFGKDTIASIKEAGPKILAFTPEIIQYLKGVSKALAIAINNFVTNKKLVDDNIAKIKAAHGL